LIGRGSGRVWYENEPQTPAPPATRSTVKRATRLRQELAAAEGFHAGSESKAGEAATFRAEPRDFGVLAATTLPHTRIRETFLRDVNPELQTVAIHALFTRHG
jgi:hypothetical protein